VDETNAYCLGRFGNAVVMQAAKDWLRSSLKALKLKEYSKKLRTLQISGETEGPQYERLMGKVVQRYRAIKTVRECEQFFLGEDFLLYSNLDGTTFLKKLRDLLSHVVYTKNQQN
jgi:hypothetical protein